jgi:hypothetical protein
MASATGRGKDLLCLRGLIDALSDTPWPLFVNISTDWMVRGRDPVVRNHRMFSDHPFRVPGDAVVGGFTELRLISVRLGNYVRSSWLMESCSSLADAICSQRQ